MPPSVLASSPPERVEELSNLLSLALSEDMVSIRTINTTTRLLSINARIEAAKAGSAGATFAVVANEVMTLAKSMDTSFRNLETRTTPLLKELEFVGAHLAREVRGQRLADLAATHLDIVDRNLYERSCDVRWWATDGGLVQALTTRTASDLAFAAQRMGTILDSYTVYFDLLLCDTQGRVLANGRPGRFPVQGQDVSAQQWFRSGLSTAHGGEFGFESVHPSRLVNNERVLVYSTAIRKDGKENSEAIGVLGVVFRWDALGQTIVEQAALAPDEKDKTQVLLIEASGRVLATSAPSLRNQVFPVGQWLAQSTLPRYHFTSEINGQRRIIALARSQGYETYATDWISVLIQKQD